MASAKQKAWQHKFAKAAKACRPARSKGKTAFRSCMKFNLKKRA